MQGNLHLLFLFFKKVLKNKDLYDIIPMFEYKNAEMKSALFRFLSQREPPLAESGLQVKQMPFPSEHIR